MKTLISWGGWDGHVPQDFAEFYAALLRHEGAEVDVVNHVECFDDLDALRGYDLIIPNWTMAKLPEQAGKNISTVVAEGTGIAGAHAGISDAFRENVDFQFVTGANWVSHPGDDGVEYTVNITDPDHEITQGIADFAVSTEQYYVYLDPAANVHATTRLAPQVDGPHHANGPVDLPVVWTKLWGQGRVFGTTMGHRIADVENPPVREMIRRGFLWAARR